MRATARLDACTARPCASIAICGRCRPSSRAIISAMAVRKFIRMGHPILRQPARPLEADEIGSPWLPALVADMVETLHDYGGIRPAAPPIAPAALVADMVETLHDYGGIGLAAPQIAEPVRVAIIEIPGGQSRYGEIPEMPLTVFIHPSLEVVDPATHGYWEGCLSV